MAEMVDFVGVDWETIKVFLWGDGRAATNILDFLLRDNPDSSLDLLVVARQLQLVDRMAHRIDDSAATHVRHVGGRLLSTTTLLTLRWMFSCCPEQG